MESDGEEGYSAANLHTFRNGDDCTRNVRADLQEESMASRESRYKGSLIGAELEYEKAAYMNKSNEDLLEVSR